MGGAQSGLDSVKRSCGSFSAPAPLPEAYSNTDGTLTGASETNDITSGIASTTEVEQEEQGGSGGDNDDEFDHGGGGHADMAPLGAEDMGVISMSEQSIPRPYSMPTDMRASNSAQSLNSEEAAEEDVPPDPEDVIRRNRLEDLEDPIRTEYSKIFDAHAHARTGWLQKEEFIKFYKDVLMALGASESQAADICIGGGAVSFFRSICEDKAFSITFEQFWAANFTRGNLLPRTGKHEAAVMKYMSQWYPGKLRRVPLDAARAPGYRGTHSLRFNARGSNSSTADATPVNMKRLPSFMQPTRSSVNKLASNRLSRASSVPENIPSFTSKRGSKTPGPNIGQRKSLASRQPSQGHIRAKTPGAPMMRKSLQVPGHGPQAPMSARGKTKRGSHERLPSVPMVLVPDADADARAASLLGRVPSRRETSALLRLSQRGPAGSAVVGGGSMVIDEDEPAAPPPVLAKQMTFK